MKKISSKGFKLFWPYLTAYRKELGFASLFGLVSGVTVVLMTYYIGVGVDLLIGAGEVDFSVLYRTLFLLAGILLVTVVSQWLIQILANRVAYKSIAELRKAGFNGFLIGENFMKTDDPGQAMQQFVDELISV